MLHLHTPKDQTRALRREARRAHRDGSQAPHKIGPDRATRKASHHAERHAVRLEIQEALAE